MPNHVATGFGSRRDHRRPTPGRTRGRHPVFHRQASPLARRICQTNPGGWWLCLASPIAIAGRLWVPSNDLSCRRVASSAGGPVTSGGSVSHGVITSLPHTAKRTRDTRWLCSADRHYPATRRIACRSDVWWLCLAQRDHLFATWPNEPATRGGSVSQPVWRHSLPSRWPNEPEIRVALFCRPARQDGLSASPAEGTRRRLLALFCQPTWCDGLPAGWPNEPETPSGSALL